MAVLRLITSSNFVGCMTGRSAGFSPLEDPAHVNPHLAKCLAAVGAVADQSAGGDELAPFVHRRQPVARGECHELLTHHLEELMRTVEHRIGVVLHDGREGLLDLTRRRGVHNDDFCPVAWVAA